MKMKTFWLKFEMEEEIAKPDLMDLTDDFPGVVEGVRVDSITLEQPLLGPDKASYEFLSAGKDEIFELLERIREDFDESEYQQGKKDGLRSALALLGNPEMADFNRGGGRARERLMKSYPITMYELERHPDEGAIVLRRGVFNGDRVGWHVTRDAQMFPRMMFPKQPDEHGLFFMETSGKDDLDTYLWENPRDAFRWWEANRDKIVAFTGDRLRLVGKAKEEP